jgi:hypothetical protein
MKELCVFRKTKMLKHFTKSLPPSEAVNGIFHPARILDSLRKGKHRNGGTSKEGG